MCPDLGTTYSYGAEFDISDAEIVQLYAFQREFGSWTSPVDAVDGNHGVISAEVCSILEIPMISNTIRSSDIVNAVHPDDRDMVIETITHSATALKPFEYTYRVTRPDGTIKIVRTMGESRRRGDGVMELFGITFSLFPHARHAGYVEPS